jgi:hypothetical protein
MVIRALIIKTKTIYLLKRLSKYIKNWQTKKELP